MLASALSPMTTKAIVDAKGDSSEASQASTTIAIEDADHPLTTVSIEGYVRDYFKNNPILAEISKCESTFRQFDSKGNVIRGIENPDDVGLMQINLFYHGDTAKKLGYDLYTVDGNLGFAQWLYEKYGSSPWVHSSKCWKKSEVYKELARI